MIFHSCDKSSPSNRLLPKFAHILVLLTDVIAFAKFGNDWFINNLLMNVQNSLLPIKTVVTITTACSCDYHTEPKSGIKIGGT